MTTKTWVGGTSTAWTTAANWTGGVPVAGDDVVITSTGTNAPTLSASTSIGSLSFTGTKTLTLANTGTVLTVTGVVPGTAFGVNFTGTSDVITGAGTINAANGINVATGGSATITVGAGGLTVTGVLSKVGTGTLALSLPIGSDVLSLTSAGSSVTSVTFGGSSRTLQLGANATLTVANAVALGGANNLITLGGPNSALTGLAGFTFSSTGTISGAGTVTGAVTAGTQPAHITANGGTLIMASAVTGTALILATSTAASTLQFNAAGNTAATLTLNNGTLKLNGSTSALTVSSSTTLGTGTITGFGTFTGTVAAAAAAGHITANGGTLVMASAVTGTALLLADTASTDTLQFNAAGNSASSVTLNSGTLRLNTATTTLSVTNALAIGTGTVNLVAVGATLTDAVGLTLAGGSITGLGSVAANTNISGFGTVAIPISTAGSITANGGLLDMQGAVTGRTLVISGTGNTLQLDAATDATASLTMNGGTLRLNGATASLSDSTALVVGSGTVNLVGGATLTDTTGISLAAGAKITGVGVVNGNISGSGAIEGSGGTLTVANNLTPSTLLLEVDSGSTLSLGGTVGTSTSFTYLNNIDFSGTLLLANATAMGSFETNGVISGMHEATGPGVAATDILDLRPIVFNAGYSTDILGGNTIQLWSNVGHTSLLASFHLASAVPTGTFVDWQNDGAGGTSLFLDDNPCFAAGTRILTATGERLVETLMQGDIVLTLAGDEVSAQPVKWLGRRRIDLTAHPRPETVAPVRIRRGALADNMPHSDLLVSPDHAIFVDGKLICARQLVNGSTIAQEHGFTSVEYFHVELDTHAILVAEGLPAESYLNTGNHGFFTNSGEPLVLHPDLTDESDYPTRAAGSCAPFVSDEASVLPVWQRLADRAAALGRPAPQFDTTTDPELRIVAKGRSLRPLYGENGLYIFALPKGATEVRVVSRAGSPTDARPWLDDRRRLGVNVERIILRGASEVRDIALDSPGLSQGWWAAERDGTAMRRWTNGEAVLRLPASGGPTMLEIRASNGGMSYVTNAERERRVA